MTNFETPRISFGIIVFNGEPFTRYCLRSLYPFAHEIIVVEGACPGSSNLATTDGHSTDDTLDSLYRFKAEEDPENKLKIVLRDGLWSEKDEQSLAYSELATGDYLWQVDIDEFYHPEDMRMVLERLKQRPAPTAVSFRQVCFWGGFDYTVDSWYLRRGGNIYHRIFRWNTGYRYVTHRPPTVQDQDGRDLRSVRWLRPNKLAQEGIYLYHYSFLFPKQVLDKSEYRSKANWIKPYQKNSLEWAKSNYLFLGDPFRVHNVVTHPSWIEPFTGQHPPAIQALREDILTGKTNIDIRGTEDIDRLLESRSYSLRRALIRCGDPVDAIYLKTKGCAFRTGGKIKRAVIRKLRDYQ
jgi:glycosyltransferase involved in cell wall biosynthesis